MGLFCFECELVAPSQRGILFKVFLQGKLEGRRGVVEVRHFEVEIVSFRANQQRRWGGGLKCNKEEWRVPVREQGI